MGPAAQGTRGRRRQYSAAQLGDQEEQVFINDIVEVAKHPPELPHRRPRLAQVREDGLLSSLGCVCFHSFMRRSHDYTTWSTRS